MKAFQDKNGIVTIKFNTRNEFLQARPTLNGEPLQHLPCLLCGDLKPVPFTTVDYYCEACRSRVLTWERVSMDLWISEKYEIYEHQKIFYLFVKGTGSAIFDSESLHGVFAEVEQFASPH